MLLGRQAHNKIVKMACLIFIINPIYCVKASAARIYSLCYPILRTFARMPRVEAQGDFTI